MLSRGGRAIVALVLWLVLMVALTSFYLWHWLNADRAIAAENRVFVVERGESLGVVARRLREAELIRWPLVWRMYARFLDPDPIKAGEYALSELESPKGLLGLFQSGDVITYQVTLVEGRTFAEFVARLAVAQKVTPLLPGKDVAEQLALLELPIEHPEGWFYPDTYKYTAGETDIAILRRAYRIMVSALEAEWATRAEDLPYNTPYEALIMASIVERETGVPQERQAIAGVFVRRLQARMRLQTDPTVIYGMGVEYQGRITREHLRTPTPYNTYVIPALPPTPIAMPGHASIHAALHPAPGDALYFVAKGDGTHHFSQTLAEHNAAVNKYQRQRVKNYRSTPLPEAP